MQQLVCVAIYKISAAKNDSNFEIGLIYKYFDFESESNNSNFKSGIDYC